MATFTYAASSTGYPGGTTAPTASQVGSMVAGTLAFADADTTITITTNFGLTAAQNLQLQPWVTYAWNAVNAATTAAPALTTSLSTNSITLGKTNLTGSGGTAYVWIQRWSSFIG